MNHDEIVAYDWLLNHYIAWPNRGCFMIEERAACKISDQYGVLNLGMIRNPYMKWTTSSTGVRILQMVSITCIQPNLVLLKCWGLYNKSLEEKKDKLQCYAWVGGWWLWCLCCAWIMYGLNIILPDSIWCGFKAIKSNSLNKLHQSNNWVQFRWVPSPNGRLLWLCVRESISKYLTLCK